MKKTFKPTQNYVLVERVSHKTSIVGLDTSKIKNDNLFDIVIIDLGPDCGGPDSSIPLKVGQMIECVDGVGAVPIRELTTKGTQEEFLIIREKDIIGVWGFTG